jgi:hypothetical protein
MRKEIKLINTKMLLKEGIEELEKFEYFDDLELGVEVASFGDAGDLFAKLGRDRNTIVFALGETRHCYDYDGNIEKCIEKFVKEYNSDPESEWLLDRYYLKIEINSSKCSYSFVEVIDEELYSCLKEEG